MANNVRALTAANPGAIAVVIVGHAHLLGEDHLVEKSRLPSTVVGAAPNRSLERVLRERSNPPASARFLRTDAGVLLLAPGAVR
jgi:hypothetical protein